MQAKGARGMRAPFHVRSGVCMHGASPRFPWPLPGLIATSLSLAKNGRVGEQMRVRNALQSFRKWRVCQTGESWRAKRPSACSPTRCFLAGRVPACLTSFCPEGWRPQGARAPSPHVRRAFVPRASHHCTFDEALPRKSLSWSALGGAKARETCIGNGGVGQKLVKRACRRPAPPCSMPSPGSQDKISPNVRCVFAPTLLHVSAPALMHVSVSSLRTACHHQSM